VDSIKFTIYTVFAFKPYLKSMVINSLHKYCRSMVICDSIIGPIGQANKQASIQYFSKFLQHPVARARTMPSNQIAEGFEFCSLIGSHG